MQSYFSIVSPYNMLGTSVYERVRVDTSGYELARVFKSHPPHMSQGWHDYRRCDETKDNN